MKNLIRNFVLKYIRQHMSHSTMQTRNEIFRAINDGCAGAFREDNLQSRISWQVGEIVRHDREFNSAMYLRDVRVVADASAREINEYIDNSTL